MNRDQRKGNAKQIKGKIKEAWGKMTDNEVTEGEGKSDRFGGKVQETVGDVKGLFGIDDDERRVERRDIDERRYDDRRL